MRFLLIANHTPHAGYGTGQRLFSLQRALAKLGDVRVVWLCPRSHDPSARPDGVDHVVRGEFASAGSRLYWTWRQVVGREFRVDAAATQAIEAICRAERIDVAVCSFFRAATAAPLRVVPCLLDADCVPEPQGRVARWCWPISRWLMRRRAGRFGTTFVIRASDAGLLDRGRTRLLPALSATAGDVIVPASDARNVLFVGNANWAPNQEAIRCLIGQLAPVLAARHPGLRIRIVGGGTERFQGGPTVSAAGFVDDLRAEYRAARLVVCPVFSGGGANVKLAEALQVGAACVASTYAAAAFAPLVEAPRDLVAAPTPAAFVDAVLELVGDDARVTQLRAAARQLAATTLNQSFVDGLLAEAVQDALARRGG